MRNNDSCSYLTRSWLIKSIVCFCVVDIESRSVMYRKFSCTYSALYERNFHAKVFQMATPSIFSVLIQLLINILLSWLAEIALWQQHSCVLVLQNSYGGKVTSSQEVHIFGTVYLQNIVSLLGQTKQQKQFLVHICCHSYTNSSTYINAQELWIVFGTGRQFKYIPLKNFCYILVIWQAVCCHSINFNDVPTSQNKEYRLYYNARECWY